MKGKIIMNKKCLLCQQMSKQKNDTLSYTKGTMELSSPSKNVLIISSNNTELLFSIKFCPLCGNKLN